MALALAYVCIHLFILLSGLSAAHGNLCAAGPASRVSHFPPSLLSLSPSSLLPSRSVPPLQPPYMHQPLAPSMDERPNRHMVRVRASHSPALCLVGPRDACWRSWAYTDRVQGAGGCVCSAPDRPATRQSHPQLQGTDGWRAVTVYTRYRVHRHRHASRVTGLRLQSLSISSCSGPCRTRADMRIGRPHGCMDRRHAGITLGMGALHPAQAARACRKRVGGQMAA